MTKQLENEKERLIDKKRNEQEERQRKQLELERILEDNRRLVPPPGLPNLALCQSMLLGCCELLAYCRLLATEYCCLITA